MRKYLTAKTDKTSGKNSDTKKNLTKNKRRKNHKRPKTKTDRNLKKKLLNFG